MVATTDPAVESLIQTRSHTFVEIDCEIFSIVILLLSKIQEGLLCHLRSMVDTLVTDHESVLVVRVVTLLVSNP